LDWPRDLHWPRKQESYLYYTRQLMGRVGGDVATYNNDDENNFVPSGPSPLETLNAMTRAVVRQLLTALCYYWHIYQTLADLIAAPAPIVVEIPAMAAPIETTLPPTPRRRTIDLPEIAGEPHHIPFRPGPGYVDGLQLTGVPEYTPATELVSDASFLICSKY
jgi:hypothetical protein